MNAVKFLKEYRRLCDEYSSCIKCPLKNENKSKDCIDADPEKMVKVVEEWSNAHPVVTNGTELMKHLPDNVRVSDEWTNEVVIYVPRDWWDTKSEMGHREGGVTKW